jgi:uncharacterized protein YlxW (UPF0749 family)
MMGNGNGWKTAQWTIMTALILAVLTGAVTMWRQFTLLQDRQAYLLQLQTSQNQSIQSCQDSVRALQQQAALLGQKDLQTVEKLSEHADFLREILGRLRAVEQRSTH